MFVWLAALDADLLAADDFEVLEADVELFEDDALDDADDDAELALTLAEESLEATTVAALEELPDEPGLSANMASATIAAKTAMAAITKITTPPPPRLGVGSNVFTLRGPVDPALAVLPTASLLPSFETCIAPHLMQNTAPSFISWPHSTQRISLLLQIRVSTVYFESPTCEMFFARCL